MGAVEHFVMAQSLARIDLELSRLRAALADLMGVPMSAPVPIQADVPTVPRATHAPVPRYARHALRDAVMAVLPADGSPVELRTLLRMIQVALPEVQRPMLSSLLMRMKAEGLLVNAPYGCYARVPHTPHLSLTSRHEALDAVGHL